jgi:hypothetical protein
MWRVNLCRCVSGMPGFKGKGMEGIQNFADGWLDKQGQGWHHDGQRSVPALNSYHCAVLHTYACAALLSYLNKDDHGLKGIGVSRP